MIIVAFCCSCSCSCSHYHHCASSTTVVFADLSKQPFRLPTSFSLLPTNLPTYLSWREMKADTQRRKVTKEQSRTEQNRAEQSRSAQNRRGKKEACA